jgi:two-component system, response regulator YesN
MKRSIFFKMVVAFSIINAAALFFVSIKIFEGSSSIVENEIALVDKSLLGRAAEVVDTISDEIEKDIIQLAMDEDLNSLVKNTSADITPEFVGDFYSTADKAFLFSSLNKNVDRVIVYSEINHTVITSEKEFHQIELGDQFNEIPNNTWLLYNGGDQSVDELFGADSLIYAKGLPIFGTISYGRVFVVLDRKMIGSTVNSNLDQNDSGIYIVDRNMNLIDSSRQLDQHILSGISDVLSDNKSGTGFKIISKDSSEFAVSWSYSPKMTWYYVKVTPLENYFKDIESMRNTIIMITLITVVISIVFIWIVSTGLYSPIIRLIKKITGSNAYFREMLHSGEMQIISEAFDAINLERDKVSELLWSNGKIISSAYVIKLMRGVLAQNEEGQVLDKLAGFGFIPEYPNYYVMQISFDYYTDFCSIYSQTDRDLFAFAVENISEELLSTRSVTISCKGPNNGLWILINTEEATPDSLMEVGHDLIDTVCRNFEFSLSVSISQMFHNVLNADRACSEATEAMTKRFFLGSGMVIVASGDKKSNESIPPLNPDLIVSVVYNASADIFVLAESICDHIRRSGVTNQTTILIWLLELLKRAEQKISNKTGKEFYFINDDNELSMLSNNETIERLYLFLSTIFSKACDHFNQNNDKCNYYIKMAVELIEKDYSKDISLDTISTKVGFTSSYFSTLFKQEMGDTYINYLSKYRISRAKEMLQEKNATVCDIAKKAGFSSSYSFIRSFKKYEGVTPGEYKVML